jgi:integrase
MKHLTVTPPAAAAVTLRNVLDALDRNPDLPVTRKRDLKSALNTYAKVAGNQPATIALDLAKIRETLDGTVPLQSKVSRKRWANLRSDLVAAIAVSGLQPMLKTFGVSLHPEWEELLDEANDKGLANGLSRLARWASLREISPRAIHAAKLDRFFSELETGTLIRNLRPYCRSLPKLWNDLVDRLPHRTLQRIDVPDQVVSRQIASPQFPASFTAELEDYIRWCGVPDPLAENARARALALETLRLRRHYIFTAANAACCSGTPIAQLTSLRHLVEPPTFRAILRHQWEKCGGKATPYLVDLASVLIVLATEWVRAPTDRLNELKRLRSKLGSVPRGLTEKNRTLLRRFDDPRLLDRMIRLPDQLWRVARRNLASSKRSFIDLQSALAIDILLHVPLRIENLGPLEFDKHLHWPQGRGKPALMIIEGYETKTKGESALEFELPVALSDRLYAFRNELAPHVIGRRPDRLFVSRNGVPRALSTLRVAIQRTVLRRVGIKITPHQFRHLAAKISLDCNPGAYELVRQLLGHKTLRTTTRFYAGPDTRRAGRAHAELIRRLRESEFERIGRRPNREF